LHALSRPHTQVALPTTVFALAEDNGRGSFASRQPITHPTAAHDPGHLHLLSLCVCLHMLPQMHTPIKDATENAGDSDALIMERNGAHRLCLVRAVSCLRRGDRLRAAVVNVQERHGSGDVVEHKQHPISLDHMQVTERLMRTLEPNMTCVYNGSERSGAYPLSSKSTIANLSKLDQSIINEFLTKCRLGDSQTTLVTKLEHLYEFHRVPTHASPEFCSGICDAFLNPRDTKGRAKGCVQMSAQFDPIVIARNNQVLSFNLRCASKAPKEVQVPASLVYSAFEEACARRKLAATTLRNLINDTTNAKIDVNNTRLAGHKVWVFPQNAPGEFVTLYLTRVKHVKKRKVVAHLAVVAADILTTVEEASLSDIMNECAICAEPLFTSALWTCERCRNQCHLTCANVWKGKASTCPFCRSDM
jgi:hypothetical protein